jgi:subtilisin family serine protease
MIASILASTASLAGATELVLLSDDPRVAAELARRAGGEVVGQVQPPGAWLIETPGTLDATAERWLSRSGGAGVLEDNVRFLGLECLQSAIWFTGRSPAPDAAVATAPAGPTAPVALLDGPIDVTDRLFWDVFAGGRDFVDGDDDPVLSAEAFQDPARRALPGNVHGTAVASVLVREAPAVALRVHRVLDEDCYATSFDLASAIVAAADEGARVILVPLGSTLRTEVVTRALSHARSRDALVVASVGNAGAPPVAHPASDPSVLAVAALDEQDRVASFSSYGPEVDLADLGVALEIFVPGVARAQGSGTSLAAARTAAAAATLRARRPELTAADVIALLTSSAVPLPPDERVPPALAGSGRTNLDAALELAAARDDP